MAEQADGSIIVDTEIDAEGFKAGSAELQRAIKSLNTKMQALGPTFQKALSGNTSAMSSFDAKAAALEDTISDLEEKLESLGDTRLPTEDYQWLTDEIEKAENELQKLEEKQIKMEDMGVKQSSQSWKSLQYDIALARQKIAEYKADQEQMKSDGTAFQMGTDTGQYVQLETALNSAKEKLAEMRSEAENAGKSTSKLGAIGNAVKKGLSTVGSAGVKGFKALVTGVKNGITHLKNFKKSSGGAEGAIGKLGKKLTGLGSMLKRMVLRKILQSVISGVKDGMNNLAQYSSKTNADLSALKSGLTQLKNSLATAFAPILSVVTPILTKLISYLSTAITYVGKLFAALSGAKTFTKATQVQENYAASLSGTGSAAKEASRQLAGFDELNVLSDSSSDNSSGSASPSEMFEEVPIESSITDFVGRLKDAFKNGNYAEIGEIIGNGINTALQKANDFIRWENVGGFITKIITGIAEGFNSLIYTVNWEMLGDTIAQGLNTVLNTIYLIITEFDWPAMAAALARSLNGLVSGFDWGKLGTTLSTAFITALKTIRSAITTFDWAGLGSGVAEGINKIDWVGAFSQAAGALSDAVKGLLDLCIGFAENLDWGKLGSDLWNSIIGILTNIDWGGIILKAFQLLGNAVGGAVSLVIGFAKSLWESLKSGFESTKSYFSKYISEAGGDVIQGLLNGIWDGIKNIGSWIKTHIFDPFINGFKNAFGIHSPSTVMAEQGNFIVEGLLSGIKNVWHTITDFFSGALDGIKNVCSQAWEGIKNGASTAWNGIKDTVSGAWNGIKSGVSTAASAVGTTVSNAWNNVKSWTSTAWSNTKTTVSNAWNSIKSTASTVGSNIASTVSTAWSNVKNHISTNLSNAKAAASTAWESIKTNASTIGSGVKTVVSNAWSGVKNLITGNLDGAKANASTAWNSIKSTASTVSNNIKTTVSNAWENTKSAISGKLSGIKTNVSNTFNTLKNNASTWGKDLCDNMANGISKAKSAVENAVSSVASKIKSFLGFSEPEAGPLSNFHTYMPDMIDLMTSGIKNNQGQAIGAVADMASAISKEIQNGDYAMGDIEVGNGAVLDTNIDTALTGFSDKITEGFTSLLDRLQAIAEGVTFAVPAAANSMIPYNVSATAAGPDNSGITEAITASNDELSSVVIQSITNATTAIVGAIQDYSGTTVNLDSNSLATNVIKEINRRTRMYNKSPLNG